MRQLWPPYHDDFSTRVWAASVSLLVHIVFAVLFCLRAFPYPMLILCAPGAVTFMMVTHQGIEEASFSWLGVIAATAVNIAFYYFVIWWLIRFLRPRDNSGWWPEKRY